MILQRIRIIVVNAGFEPGTSTPEVWCATNDPPHPQVFYHVQEVFVRCCMVACRQPSSFLKLLVAICINKQHLSRPKICTYEIKRSMGQKKHC